MKRITRRALLGAAFAAGALPSVASIRLLADTDIQAARALVRSPRVAGRLRVLFVGNSFTYGHDVPGRVAALADVGGTELDVATLAEGGARLAQTLARPGVRDVLEAEGWDAVVLQDHSTTAFDPAYRHDSSAAIAYAAMVAAPRPVLVVTPWARAPDHPIYREGAVIRAGLEQPESPQHMTEATARYFEAAAAEAARRGGANVHLAPVARRWFAASREGAPLYGPDRYHASPDGAALVASVVWEALAPLLV
ncbi:MAG: SGNH/GDSL hydrolase family protein [Pseudomonadota bacterium]